MRSTSQERGRLLSNIQIQMQRFNPRKINKKLQKRERVNSNIKSKGMLSEGEDNLTEVDMNGINTNRIKKLLWRTNLRHYRKAMWIR